MNSTPSLPRLNINRSSSHGNVNRVDSISKMNEPLRWQNTFSSYHVTVETRALKSNPNKAKYISSGVYFFVITAACMRTSIFGSCARITVSIRNILAKGILHLSKEREETVVLDNLIKKVQKKCHTISLKYDLTERVKT